MWRGVPGEWCNVWFFWICNIGSNPGVRDVVSNPEPPGPVPPPESCGVNPVTNSPGLSQKESGKPGELRPGKGGKGKFGDDRKNSNGWYPHAGVDIAGEIGSEVVSALAGKVIRTDYQEDGWGKFVIVDIGNGVTMVHAHLQGITVREGDLLLEGGTLGTLGQTGNAKHDPASEAHVHLEVRLSTGTGIQLLDPFSFLNNPCKF